MTDTQTCVDNAEGQGTQVRVLTMQTQPIGSQGVPESQDDTGAQANFKGIAKSKANKLSQAKVSSLSKIAKQLQILANGDGAAGPHVIECQCGSVTKEEAAVRTLFHHLLSMI